MRKILCFFIFIILVVFSGCRSVPPELKGDFTAEVFVKFSEPAGNSDSATLEVSGDFLRGQGSFTVATPDELSTLSYKWGRDFEVSFDGLICRTDTSHLPKTALPRVLYSVLCHVTVNGKYKGKSGEFWEFQGCTEGISYKVLADKNGYIRNISVEELNLSADFSYEK